MIDLSKITKLNNKLIEPRDIFMSLSHRAKKYDYPRDVQTEVWKQWFENRNEEDNIIKMNTGSGKTVVGLVILQSCLNETHEPAVFVVPDNYLVDQVIEEAENLGIDVTTNYDDTGFVRGQKILIIPIHKLVNGKSRFGMQDAMMNFKVNSIIVDDVHACLNTIRNQFSVVIDKNDPIYTDILSIFSESLKQYDESEYDDLINKVPRRQMMIPFWDWQNKCNKVAHLISNSTKEYAIFNYPLIKDAFDMCMYY